MVKDKFCKNWIHNFICQRDATRHVQLQQGHLHEEGCRILVKEVDLYWQFLVQVHHELDGVHCLQEDGLRVLGLGSKAIHTLKCFVNHFVGDWFP
jgi:hypothetical protein